MARLEPEEEQPLLSTHDDGNNDELSAEKTVPDTASHPANPGEGNEETSRVNDPRFNPPPPSPWKRVALIAFVGLLFFCGFQLRAALLRDRKPNVIYASRYSKEYKFRPAASPVITEHLKDGRVRLRGALPAPAETPTPTNTSAKKRRSKTGRAERKAKRKQAPATATS